MNSDNLQTLSIAGKAEFAQDERGEENL